MTEEVFRNYSGAPWESQVGYCRAIRAGNQIYVTGTAPMDNEGKVVAPGDAYEQTKRCLEIIDKAVHDLAPGSPLIVRTRMFVTDINQWEAVGRAHREWFDGRPPATTMVEVRRLIDPDILVEVEADAVIP